MAEYKDEGILDKILTLVAPPLPPSSQKGRGGSRKGKSSSVTAALTPAPAPSSSARHTGMQNHPYCDACGDGGNLLCCDTCPASFHFNCCDPPIDPKNIPSGDWLCRHCLAGPVGEEVPTIFQPLVEFALGSNPRVFSIPYELQRKDILPGSSRKELKQARLYHHHGDQDQCKFCYTCNKNSNHGRMVSCDFCPLVFHLDCLDPPLTTPPTTVWMCPVHPNTKIPGFDHPRLSQRLTALERSHADIPFHTIRTDFIRQLRKIPHYKRITSHHNRRVMQVPSAIKFLYQNPLPDVHSVPTVCDSLLTPTEDVWRWRQEEERERKLFTAPRPPTLTHNQDEWARRTVLEQVYTDSTSKSMETADQQVDSPPISPTASSNSVLMAAQQLLELSTACGLKPRTREEEVKMESPRSEGVMLESHEDRVKMDIEEGVKPEHEEGVKMELGEGVKPNSPHALNGFVKAPHSHALSNNRTGSGLPNGVLCAVDDEEEEGEREGERHTKDLSPKTASIHTPAVENPVASPKVSSSPLHTSTDLLPSTSSAEEGVEGMDTGDQQEVPDLSHLDPKVVQLLALQRLQQLLSQSSQQDTTLSQANKPTLADTDSLTNQVKEQTQLLLNGWTQFNAQKPQKKGSLHTAPALLCPLSGTTIPLTLHKQVTSIGTGSHMDVCLTNYGHCNYISSRQACIFYDKASQDYELINYSEHGTIVDGVLYSCDFSNNPSTNQSEVVLTLQDLSSLGKGRRASQAKARLEAARRSLQDKQEAKRALEAALQLSVPLKDDLSLAEELSKCEGLMTRTGLKRVAGTDSTANNRNSSVVLSIPLSKTKKSDTSNKKGTARRASPAKPQTQETTPKTDSRSSSTKQEAKQEPGKIRTQTNAVRTQLNVTASAKSRTVHESTNQKKTSSEQENSDTELMDTGQPLETTVEHRVPCGCSKSLSSVVGTSGKGWEGTATLYHGSKLRFGCLQFILSLSGQPGHSELLQALHDQFGLEVGDS